MSDNTPEDGDTRIRVHRVVSDYNNDRIRIVRDGYDERTGWYAENAIVAPSEAHLSELIDEIKAFIDD